MNAIDVLRLLKTTTRLSEKEALLVEHKDVPELKSMLQFMVNPYIVVGLSTKKLQRQVGPISGITTFDEMVNYLINHPTGTDEDIAHVHGYIESLHPAHRAPMYEIIAKSWVVSVGEKTLNKVFGHGFIPTFSVQLAYPVEKKIGRYKSDDVFYVTQKLDGFRAVIVIQNGSVAIRSRNGKVVTGLVDVERDILPFAKQAFSDEQIKDGIVFDGELLAVVDEGVSTADQFQKTAHIVGSNGEKRGVQYHIFDVLTLKEFSKGQSNDGYEKRRELLDSFTNTGVINVVPVLKTVTTDDIPSLFDMIIENQWEGVMLNAKDAKYQTSRSPYLLKVKEMHTADLPIVGFEQSTSGAFTGLLGALIVQLDETNTVLVGSGLTIEQREYIWDHQEQYLGRMIEVQYFEETKNKNGGRSLRFPVFKVFRDDKTVEDVSFD